MREGVGYGAEKAGVARDIIRWMEELEGEPGRREGGTGEERRDGHLPAGSVVLKLPASTMARAQGMSNRFEQFYTT